MRTIYGKRSAPGRPVRRPWATSSRAKSRQPLRVLRAGPSDDPAARACIRCARRV